MTAVRGTAVSVSAAASRLRLLRPVQTAEPKLGTRVGVLDDASVVRLNRALVVFLGIAGSVSGG